jgi:hypothetical protein
LSLRCLFKVNLAIVIAHFYEERTLIRLNTAVRKSPHEASYLLRTSREKYSGERKFERCRDFAIEDALDRRIEPIDAISSSDYCIPDITSERHRGKASPGDARRRIYFKAG